VCVQCGCEKRGTSRPPSRVFSASSAAIAAAMPVHHDGGSASGRRFAAPRWRAGAPRHATTSDRLRQRVGKLNRSAANSLSHNLSFRRNEKAAHTFRRALVEVAHGGHVKAPRLLDGCRGLFARARRSPNMPKLTTHEDYAAFAAAVIVQVSHSAARAYSPFPLRLMRDVLAHRCGLSKAAGRLNDMVKAVAAVEPMRRKKKGPQAVHRWSRWIAELPLGGAGPPKESSLEFGYRRDAGTRLLVGLERAARAARVPATSDNALCAALLWIVVALMRGDPALHPEAVGAVCGADNRVRAMQHLLSNATFVNAAETKYVPPQMMERWRALRVRFHRKPPAGAPRR
jgi:hypothetical protein